MEQLLWSVQTDKGGRFESHPVHTGQQQLSTQQPEINKKCTPTTLTKSEQTDHVGNAIRQHSHTAPHTKALKLTKKQSKPCYIQVSIILLLDISSYIPYVNDSLKSQTIWPRITELTACSARNIIKSTHFEWTLNLTQSVAYSLYIETIQHNNIEPISLPVNLKSINQYTPSRSGRCLRLIR